MWPIVVNWGEAGGGLFAGKQQFKASLHAHTLISDGRDYLPAVIEEYYLLGYDLLAITDHNVVMRDWRISPKPERSPPLTAARFAEIAAGTDRQGRGMLMIPDTIEQSFGAGPAQSDHINTFLANYENWYDIDALLTQVGSLAGLAHFNHIGRTIANLGTGDTVNTPAQIDRYAGFFLRHAPHLVGLEIMNSPTNVNYAAHDRRMWDNINRVTIPQGRYVWGFCNNDTHWNQYETGFTHNMMVMPENTVEAFKAAMLSGSFYAVSRIAKEEGVNVTDRESITPAITNIIVGETTIAITAEHYTRIDWITEGTQTVAQGDTVDISTVSGVGVFIRANVIGNGGIAFTQPFGVVGGRIIVPGG